MPVLILPIAKDFHKLFEDCCSAAVAPLGILCRIVVMTVHLSFMLVVAVLCAEDSRTDGAGEMLYMVLSIKRGNVGAA